MTETLRTKTEQLATVRARKEQITIEIEALKKSLKWFEEKEAELETEVKKETDFYLNEYFNETMKGFEEINL